MPRSKATRELPPATYTAPDRDPVITIDGCRIYLHIHDAEYLRQKAEWKRRLSAAHPDHGGSSAEFIRLTGQRQAWQNAEQIYYARLGLFPPDSYGEHTPGIHHNIRQRALDASAARTDPSHRRTSDRRLTNPRRLCNQNRKEK